MGKYQSSDKRRARYEMVAMAEGEECIFCHFNSTLPKKLRLKKKSTGKLILEHADNNPKNWAWGNLHLACYPHNRLAVKLSTSSKIRILLRLSGVLKRERERENLSTWETVLKDEIPYQSGSPEMQAHKRFYPIWLEYVHEKLHLFGTYDKRELIRGAARASGCSIQTSRNYLEKNTSEDEGPFREGADANGNKIVKLMD